MKSKTLDSRIAIQLLLIITILLPLSLQRVGLTTQYDGITSTRLYNQFMVFDGTSGIYLKDNQVEQLSNYTMTIWIKLDKSPKDLQRSMTILSAKPKAFDLYFNKNFFLVCSSDSGSQFQINGQVRLGIWYILVLRSKSDYSLLQIKELSNTVFTSDNLKKFFPFNQNSLTITSYTIGIDDDQKSNGFIGSIRNFRILSNYYEDNVLYNYQFIYLFPQRYIPIQLLLNEAGNYKNDADSTVGKVVGKSSSLSLATDNNGIFWCWNNDLTANYYSQFLIMNSNFALKQQTLSTSIFITSGTTSNYETSLQLWIYRKYISSPSNDEPLFLHTDLLRMTFFKSDYTKLVVQNENQKASPITLTVPFNRWQFLQVSNALSSLTVSLFENDGYQSFSQKNTFSTQVKKTSRTINFPSQFNGYIQGMKYYKTSSPPNNPSIHVFQFNMDSNTYLLFYYLLTPSGVRSDTSFQNLAQSGKYPLEISSGSIVFEQVFFKTYGESFTNGTVNNAPTLFDGYTCIDNKEKLYFNGKDSYAYSTFKLNNSLSSYTIEFWMSSTQSLSGETYFISLQDSSRSSQIYTAIKQESDNSLNCYSFITSKPKIKMNYLDYNEDQQIWQHISCIYDGNSKQISGSLYNNLLNYNYFLDLTESTNLPQQSYVLWVNQDPRSSNSGAKKIYYSEIRFWSYARNLSQISGSRFHQINLNLERQYLYSYMKFLSGMKSSSGSVNETDFADYSMNRQITYNNVQWLSKSDLTICPIGMYKSSSLSDSTCYREGITQFNLIVYKKSNSYVVTPQFSKYRNSYLREYSTSIYDFQWSLDKMNTGNSSNTNVFPSYFNSQQNKQDLEFSFDQVSQAGKYKLTLEMTDKLNFQNTQQGSIDLQTFKCANIFDRETAQSLVYKDMDTQKGAQDAYFYYNYSDCADYKLDQSSMTFSVDVDGVNIFSSDHDTSAKSFLLKSQQQTSLPINEYFYIRVKGVWKNVKDKSDTIEYYLIYACRYSGKLVVTLQSNYIALTKGQTLVVDYNAVFYNLKNIEKDRKFKAIWSCPGGLNKYCSAYNDKSLRLVYDQIADSGISFWQTQTITLTAYTDFIQGDGLKYSQKSIDVVWINIQPDATIVNTTKYPTKYQDLSLELQLNNLKEDQIQIQWNVSPSVSSKCYINSNNRKQFVINQTCLNDATTYSFSTKVVYNVMQQVIWSKVTQMTIPKNPWGGSFSCSSTSGKAYIDQIKCTASGWQTNNSPLRYQFFINKNGDPFALSSIRTENEFSTTYPPTSQIMVKIIDSKEAYTLAQFSVQITYQQSTQLSTKITESLTQAAITKEFQNAQMIQDFQIVTQIITQSSSGLDSSLITNTTSKLTSYILKQSEILQQLNFDNRRFFIQGSLQIFNQITSNLKYFRIQNLNQMQECIMNLMQNTDVIELIYNDKSFYSNFFSIQSNILNTLYLMKSSGQIDVINNDFEELSNITSQLRTILVNFEKYHSTKLIEGQTFTYNTTAFSYRISKYSRMADSLANQTTNSSSLNITFPLENANEPSERQSFTQILFYLNPFIGTQLVNQTINTNTSVYFAYRDSNGAYLDNSNIKSLINMKFRYNKQISNATTCAYINIDYENWENKSCQTYYDKISQTITCSCQHMSFYAVIDDYFIRSEKTTIFAISYKNWIFAIGFFYLVVIFMIGVIYTYNRDNYDYRFLHYQDENSGNNLNSDRMLTLISVALKRKVFYAGFQKYSFCGLYKLYLMLMHPIFQLKYQMDPQLPRYYKFQVLFTRITLLFGVSFYFLRDLDNFDEFTTNGRLISDIFYSALIGSCGSLIFIPLPIFLYGICRSRYFLIKPIITEKDSEADATPKTQTSKKSTKDQQSLSQRITNVQVDVNMPLKLLFHLNSVSHEKLIEEAKTNYRYSRGNLSKVAKILAELDQGGQKPFDKWNDLKATNTIATDRYLRDTVVTQQHDGTQTNRGISRSLSKNFYTQDAGDQSQTQNFEALRSQNRTLYQTSKEGDVSKFDESQINNRSEMKMLDVNQLEFEIEQEKDNHEESKSQNHDDKQEPDADKKDSNDQSNQKSDLNIHSPNKSIMDSNPDVLQESQISLDSNLLKDDTKELIENRNIIGRMISNILLITLNLAILAAVFYIFVNEQYYNVDSKYLWIIVFFGSQIVGFFIIDMIVILLMAISVGCCCKKKKGCLVRLMRECLYIYEDYRYVSKFTDNNIPEDIDILN